MVVKNGKPLFLDFFAGSGLVSEGLKRYFSPIWANDISYKKYIVYSSNHPKEIFRLGPLECITGDELPGACLSWGSFPCQDLSLAGNMEGLGETRSGLVWQWLRVMDEMKVKPPLVVAENVVGLISVANGEYYCHLHNALEDRGYNVGALVLDASFWVPQSRKRIFVIAVDQRIPIFNFITDEPIWCHPASLVNATSRIKKMIWWSLPKPVIARHNLADLIEKDIPFDHPSKRDILLNMIPDSHWGKMEMGIKSGNTIFPGYKRIRGGKQVLELRFDGLAGCLRTPEGGSSRQILVVWKDGSFQTRLVSVTEAAALMGVRKNYKIPGSYNDGYKAMGDAVAVPVTRYIAQHLLFPIAKRIQEGEKNELRYNPKGVFS